MKKQLLKITAVSIALVYGNAAIAADAPAKTTQAKPAAASSYKPVLPTTPLAVPSGNPGMRNADGSLHPAHKPNVTTKTVNVVQRAAELGLKIDLADSEQDDQPAIEAVLMDAAITAGTTVFFPKGIYNLIGVSKEHSKSNLKLTKDFVNLEGESMTDTIFKSHLDSQGSNNYVGLNLQGVHDVVVKNITFSSNWNKKYSLDTKTNSPDGGGLSYVIMIAGYGDKLAHNITVDSVIVEKFKKMGVRIAAGSRDITIKNSIVRNTTDVGPKGSGYGIVVQGDGHENAPSNPFLATPSRDASFVLIEGNKTEGPYVRHAALIQYWAHNNLITKNDFSLTQLDTIDLHGEDEYANEISFNTVSFSERAGIALGNSGAGHDKTGADNWIHSNVLISNNTGISVEYGTPRSTIERNLIQDNVKHSPDANFTSGIFLGKSSDSVLRDNIIANNTVSGFVGLLFVDSRKEGDEEAGSPTNWKISGNKVVNSGTAFVNRSTMSANNEIQTSW